MYQQTITQQLRACIEEGPTQIFLGRGFAHLGSARQLRQEPMSGVSGCQSPLYVGLVEPVSINGVMHRRIP